MSLNAMPILWKGPCRCLPRDEVFIAYWRESELAVAPTGRQKVLERRLAWLLVPIEALLCLGK